MIIDGFAHQIPDIDPDETAEWVDSFNALVDERGRQRATFMLMKLLEAARERQVGFPATVSTPYINTIAPENEPWFPGDEAIERRIRAFIRWNAAVMVTRANHAADGIGGHLSTYASSAALYEVGFNHFFRGKDTEYPGDFVYFQGHASPGFYARAFLEGRLTEAQLNHFRMEVGGQGLSSYPHPRLMPDFWEFPTVSMGLGPIQAIYHAMFNRYMENRKLAQAASSRIWAFVGDGELDEPEAVGALGVAGREHLDNLIFVVNCNLQRLDGPVRGNGKIIQELEATFRGAGWNVIKVIWGSKWDELLARDVDGVLLNKMNTTPDGDFQKLATESGAYIREHFFGPDPRLRRLVEHLSDEELQALPRGGHDYRKLYAAYHAAVNHTGSPTAILAKTIKGWTLGPDIEARNATHQIKKMTREQLLEFRDRLHLNDVISDEMLAGEDPPYITLPPGSIEEEYLHTRRRVLGGYLPKRVERARSLPAPSSEAFAEFYDGSGAQAVSTTMVMARILRSLIKDPQVGSRIAPIVPDEARTFGLEALFREAKIYSSIGQLYTPVDAGLLLSYTEAQDGQILEMGITEAGATAMFTAAGTSYATLGVPMIPVYLFYSMFGFQRTMDLLWAASDARARGFLVGATAGRTTLLGEGLQHTDGHSLLLAAAFPNVQAYDPAFAYEIATVFEHGIADMYGPQPRDVIYYLTTYNENYPMPPAPDHLERAALVEAIMRGGYLFRPAPEMGDVEPISAATPRDRRRPVTLFFSGTAHRAVLEAQSELARHWGVAATAFSITSYKRLREDALEAERTERLTGTERQRVWLDELMAQSSGPIVATTDYVRLVAEQVANFVDRPFLALGTDGFGRSDTREALRRFFEVDAAHVVVAAIAQLVRIGEAKPEELHDALAHYGVSPERFDPTM
ncbi:2-oxo-acid dehydrogenase E1 subunit, homodimeric type [Acidimicrobium ferrooxidans DSM 10331]|uniref:Pyruvate dehydrogenase E1 component n=1 Tax=Acidimicrobium ferrooxidans (strain DSM 10331 / JCM 15462 / NBRC 103882 / ICP) TaxID=525909 RepID=C7LY55_ACIFD|nr:pyruvate dehydrogenase (acetyl-transferring), homodimeric type [Acidimicrobium ferrooxidans]ACU53663.1 2-oxo-acid dehydrogenase E1 subunit, homodimeric type [Acidimicrobium ferrooxidans DSM 10331]